MFPQNDGLNTLLLLLLLAIAEGGRLWPHMHRINTSDCGKQGLAQLKHQLNFGAPVSKQPNQHWMRDCTGLHPRKSRARGQQQTKGGLVHIRAEYGPLTKRSHQENREQLLS